ncbi:hypothetical protein ACFOOP_01480 [Marinicaulis aureus]|uniref:Uncharacterized protein n=1 Tax=Hyphococcus aureus TaxID=2666033 RepID=A0ABW1KWZ5_9PROT
MAARMEHDFSEADEGQHPIGPEPNWQESVVLVWWDDNEGVGGFLRFGHEPKANYGEGVSCAWASVQTRAGDRYSQYLLKPFEETDRADPKAFRIGKEYCAAFDGEHSVWTINEPECEARLETDIFTPRFDLFGRGQAVTNDYAPGHLEAAGNIWGELRLGDRRCEVKGFCYRDHSWGNREWGSFLSHRWVAGTCGPELTFNVTTWHAKDGSLGAYGLVIRNGVVKRAKNVDVVTFIERDALTHRGGVASLYFDDEDPLIVQLTAIDAFITTHNGIVWTEQVSVFDYQGMRGMANFSTSNNARAGTGPILGVHNGTLERGVSRRERPIEKLVLASA